jgi:hypothetical protein
LYQKGDAWYSSLQLRRKIAETIPVSLSDVRRSLPKYENAVAVWLDVLEGSFSTSIRQEYIIALIIVRILRDLERSGELNVERISVKENLQRGSGKENAQMTQRPRRRPHDDRLNLHLKSLRHDPQEPATVANFQFNSQSEENMRQINQAKRQNKSWSRAMKFCRESRCSIQ